MIIGPDVSFYQDDNSTPQQINFTTMKSKGVGFVFIRAGQRSWPDPDFAYNWANSKIAGIPRGSYWFYDNRETPLNQANLYIKTLNGDFGELPLVVDLELDYVDGTYGGWKNWQIFLEKLKELVPNKPIMIYTGYYYWKDRITTQEQFDYFRQYDLWIANYNPVECPLIPLPWTNWTFWQYTDTGDGLSYGVESNRIDLDRFNGTLEELIAKYGITVIPIDTDIHINTHIGVDYYKIERFGVKCFVHIFDTKKVRIFVTDGFRTVRDAINLHRASGGFNGGGWPDIQTVGHRFNEITVSDGTILQSTALDDRGYINVSKDGTIRISPTDKLGTDLWNTWGYDRILGTNGVFNPAISDLTVKDARCVSGFTADGKLVIVVAEGNDYTNTGFTHLESWEVLKEFGVITGGNNDGGGNPTAINLALNPGMLNISSGGEEPKVLNQVLFFADGSITPPDTGGIMKTYKVNYIID